MTELQEMTDKELFGNAEEQEQEASEAGSEAEEEADMSDVEEQKEAEVAEKEYDSEVEEDDDDESDFDSEAEPEEEYNLDGGSNKKKKARVGGAKAAAAEEEGASEAGASEAEEEAASEAGSEAGSEDDDSDNDDDYLQKFSQNMRDDLISNFHPESKSHNYEEIKQLAKVTRNKNGIVVDELHKTIPILTKYEKTRILGQRAKQIETGAVTLVQVPPNIIDSYLIAKLELAQGKIPFIIRRPLPNGGMEYWYVSDLEDL